MLTEEHTKVFFDKLNMKFKELGLPEQTASYITRQIQPLVIEDNKVISNCKNLFYRDHIITPKINEIDMVVKECWGKEFSFEILDEYENKNKKKLSSHENNYKKLKHKKKQNVFSSSTKLESQTTVAIDDQAHTAFANIENKTIEINEAPIESQKNSRTLIPEFSFDTFVRGESNVVAYSACEAVAKNPGNLSNPLFIYGATGLGKTHLLHSVGNEIFKHEKNTKILYVTSADFVNEVIHAIRFGKMEEVRKKYYACDVLLVDDIQFLENKDACQVEFFHTFNELYQRRKQIVITSDKFPKDIPNIEERLKSRFMQGLLVDVEPPGFEDRVAIIETKSRLLGLSLNHEIIFLIATHLKTNVRVIEGVLKTLLMSQHMNGMPPSIDFINNLLKRVVGFQAPSLDITTIQKAVANHFHVKFSELMGQNRTKHFVTARHIAMYLARDMLCLPVIDIAKSFGKKDHTTVVHALAKIKELLEEDLEIRNEFLQIRKKIESNLNTNLTL
ncbi:MAG: chromosomal replication initiator protein DnaA [Silvanigrellaceae bacterium]|nr:chromosomal replication initiator protein DnaA [Silvanigrellaceae bacterium]